MTPAIRTIFFCIGLALCGIGIVPQTGCHATPAQTAATVQDGIALAPRMEESNDVEHRALVRE